MCSLYFAIMSFATGLVLTEAEKAEVAHLLKPLGMSMALVNDLYSFDKELADQKAQVYTVGGEIMYNGVAFIQHEKQISIAEAKQELRIRILGLEREFEKLRHKWTSADRNPSQRLQEFVHCAAMTASGSAYWHAKAPRYHSECRHGSPPTASLPSATSSQTFSTSPGGLSELTSLISRSRLCSQSASNVLVENPIHAPYTYLQSLPSKGIRSMLAAAFNVWLGVPKPELDAINDIIKDLHTASLMLDDIQDNSTLRRGKPAAHVLFGEPQTINAASFLIVKGMRQVQENLKPDSMAIYVGRSRIVAWYHLRVSNTNRELKIR